MKTWFYNRSIYVLETLPIPQCFVDLDDVFDIHAIGTFSTPYDVATNLCRRIADIDFYATEIETYLKIPNKWHAATIAGTLLVSYFSACKSLLDAVAITLNQLIIYH